VANQTNGQHTELPFLQTNTTNKPCQALARSTVHARTTIMIYAQLRPIQKRLSGVNIMQAGAADKLSLWQLHCAFGLTNMQRSKYPVSLNKRGIGPISTIAYRLFKTMVSA